MSLLFSLRGGSLDARYAAYDANHGLFDINGTNPPALETTGWTGEIGASSIKMRNNTTSITSALIYTGRKNTPACGFSVNMRVAFAVNTGLLGLWGWGGGPYTNINHAGVYFNSGTLVFRWIDFGGNNRVNISGSWTPTINTFYDIFVQWDGTTTSNAAKMYVDNSLLVQGTSAIVRPADDRPQTTGMFVGAFEYDVNATCIDVNEFTIWDDQQNPASVVLTGGSAALNGSSRTQFVDCIALDGSVSTSAGVANIRLGTTETIAGVVNTGTARIPPVGKVQSGYAYDSSDSLTGTYVAAGGGSFTSVF